MKLVRLSILATALAAGCTVGPDYARPPAIAGATANWVEPATPGAVDAAWWRQFGDPQLTALIERAAAGNPDAAEAAARLAEVRANRDAAAGGRLPTISAAGSVNANRLSERGQLPIQNIPGFDPTFRLFELGFDASWELDLWGRNTRTIEAATARVEAAEAGRRDILLSLTAEIARTYFELRAAQADAALLRQIAEAEADLARLTGLRFAAGEVSRQELEAAGAAARASAADIALSDARSAGAAYRIAALVGAAPEEIAPALRAPSPFPASPDTILTGVRSELLERRPDVRRAERELAAATADIGVATTDLFPRFSLLGGIGQQARSIDDLFGGDATRFQIGPAFSWPIFAGGTIRARIRAADARADAAVARYEKAVVGALSDSETAINRFLNAGTSARETSAAVARDRAAFALATQRVARGEDDRLALARARKSLLASERRAVAANTAKAEAAVALFKALGGGWAA